MIISDNHLSKDLSQPVNTAVAGQTASAAASEQTAQPAKAEPVMTPEDKMLAKLLAQSYQESSATFSTTVGKALSQAGLAPSARNYQIVSLLLESGMSISRDSIRNMVSEAAAYPDIPEKMLVDMAANGIEINQENVDIIRNFNDHTATLANEINEIADLIETVLSSSDTSPELDTAIRLAISDVVNAAEQKPGEVPSDALAHITEAFSEAQDAQAGTNATQLQNDAAALAEGSSTVHSASNALTGAASANALSGAASSYAVPTGTENSGVLQTPSTQRIVVETTPASLPEQPETEEGGNSFASGSFREGSDAFAGQAVPTTEESVAAPVQGRVSVAESDRLYEEISGSNLEAAQEADEIFASAMESNPDRTGLHRILADEFKAMSPAELKKALKGALSLRPGELDKNNVKELYKRTYEFLDKIKTAAKDADFAAGSELGAKSQNASKQLETLYKFNNLYPHFELPVKLSSGEGQSGLYVYANKRSRSIKADATSALLHLNMPNLGEVNVHLSLTGRNLGIRFYSEDESLGILKGNIGELTDKLEEKDYSVNTSFNPPEKEKKDEAELSVVKNEKKDPQQETKRYNFDIRA